VVGCASVLRSAWVGIVVLSTRAVGGVAISGDRGLGSLEDSGGLERLADGRVVVGVRAGRRVDTRRGNGFA